MYFIGDIQLRGSLKYDTIGLPFDKYKEFKINRVCQRANKKYLNFVYGIWKYNGTWLSYNTTWIYTHILFILAITSSSLMKVSSTCVRRDCKWKIPTCYDEDTAVGQTRGCHNNI